MKLENSKFLIEFEKEEIETICNEIAKGIQEWLNCEDSSMIRNMYLCKEKYIEAMINGDLSIKFSLLTELCNLIQWTGVPSNILIAINSRYDRAISETNQ